MTNLRSFVAFVESFHRAFKAQGVYAQDHPHARHALDALFDLAARILEDRPSFELRVQGDQLETEGQSVEGTPNASLAVAQAMRSHGILSLTFDRRLESEDLQLLFFVLHLRPQRLVEMGGVDTLMADAVGIHVRLHSDPPPAAPGPLVPAVPSSPRAMADDLLGLFGAVVQMTAAPIRPNPKAPWTMEQRESLTDYGFQVCDLASISGTGDQLGLATVDPTTLRNALRTALSSLDPFLQGSLVLGMQAFPSEEMALRRALDYLSPELMAQALAAAHGARPGSKFDLALAAAAMLHCVKDRDLAIEALKGRLMMEGWSLADADALEEAIRWECHGTDTKLRLSLTDRSFFELDATQLAILVRQLARGRRTEGLRDLLAQFETGFSSPHIERRRLAAVGLADLAECLTEPGLPPEAEARLLSVAHGHITTEEDAQAARWSCQAMEALLGHWMQTLNFAAIYAEMLALSEVALSKSSPDWKSQAIKDLLARLASPPNLACMIPLLHQKETQVGLPQLHALLTLLGRPAAQYLVACLELEEDRTRRSHLLSALRAIGRNAVPALIDALASAQWFLVRNALNLLGEIGQKAAFSHVALALGHRDLRVRKAALQAVVALGSPEESLEALLSSLKESDPTFQLDLLTAVGELGHTGAVPTLLELVGSLKGTAGDAARVRLRVVEVLGILKAPEALPALQDLFKRRGFLASREGTAIRLAAVKALETMGSRESRETLALILDQENDDDIRTAIRQILVSHQPSANPSR